MSASDLLIDAARLTRVYRVGPSEIRAVDGIDLAVPRGEFLGILGVSGSGKSTLLHLLGGLDTPTSGEIVVDGHRLAAMNPYQRSLFRRAVAGFIFQSFYLVDSLTAEQNVRLALTFQGTFGAERSRLAVEALERVGLADRMRHRPGQLSVGQQQRVAVARAIVHRPALLLADEPTANLDGRTAAELLALLQEIRRQYGTTIVMVSHDERLVDTHCDRTVQLRDGRISNEGRAA